MWLLLCFGLFCAASGYKDPHWFVQCFDRPLRVGDAITMNNMIIHADHRIQPGPGEGTNGTHLNCRNNMGPWVREEHFSKIPFAGGPFELTFRIAAINSVHVHYASGVWQGATYARGGNVPLHTARQIDCNGDLTGVTFHGPVMRGIVRAAKSRPDCTQPIIGISDFALIKQHIINDGDKYTARWNMNDLMLDFVGGDYGIIGSMGELWREQRRLTLHIMRDFGMGRNIMEDRVMVEHEFDIAVGSVINNILFGYRFDEQHLDEFSLVKESLRDLVKILTAIG
ncbi:unnamed protein product, partial [Mesorhabditis spiculigera]